MLITRTWPRASTALVAFEITIAGLQKPPERKVDVSGWTVLLKLNGSISGQQDEAKDSELEV